MRLIFWNIIMFISGMLLYGQETPDNLIKNHDFKKLHNGFPKDWTIYGGKVGNVKMAKDEKNGQAIEIIADKEEIGIKQKIVAEFLPSNKMFLTVSAKALSGFAQDGALVQLRFLPSQQKSQISLKLSDKRYQETMLTAVVPAGTIEAELYIYTQKDLKPGFLVNETILYDSGVTVKTPYKAAACPAVIPADWLNPEKHPVLVCSREDYFRTRNELNSQTWKKQYLEEQKKKCAPVMRFSDMELAALIPKPGCIVVYGLGMNLDPIKGQRLLWGGWNAPFTVKDTSGNVYPSGKWPDDGNGVTDPATGKKYYFKARACGFIYYTLENDILPALGDCYALTGDPDYARKAAVLLDCIAASFPVNKKGPADYPGGTGRLDRANYMVARGLYNYATAIDLIAPSGELDKKSMKLAGKSIKENIIRNMLWNGGAYCLEDGLNLTAQLNNGKADYYRGSGIIGLLLGEKQFLYPMAEMLDMMFAMNIDRNGFYYETSPLYENHTMSLYATMAELVDSAIKIRGWNDLKQPYENEKFYRFINGFFNRYEIGGHIPMIGDSGPDSSYTPPLYRMPSIRGTANNPFLENQIRYAWVLLVRSNSPEKHEAAANLLRNTFAGEKNVAPPTDRWMVFHINGREIGRVNDCPKNKNFFETGSVFYGAKGNALLRGGHGEKRFGAQLFWGPICNHGQKDILSWTFVSDGVQWSYDPGYCNTHYRFGWNFQSVAHQMMTVDAKSIDKECGSGYMKSWLNTPDVQWALGEHNDAYAEANKYQRLIAQVSDPVSGELAYWLDSGMVGGGKMRDDSFHLAMSKMESSLKFTQWKDYSLFGNAYEGKTFGADYRLSGFSDKAFYWIPPGEGYGFLTKPSSVKQAGTVQMKFTEPALRGIKDVKAEIIADFSSIPDAEIIQAYSVSAGAGFIPSVPYIIRRHTSPGNSIFTKIVRSMKSASEDKIAKFTLLPVISKDPFAHMCIVEWKNKLRDIWYISDGVSGSLKLPDGGDFSCDALVAMVRLDGSGKVISARMSGGTLLKLKDFSMKGSGTYSGKVTQTVFGNQPVETTVVWNRQPEKAIPGGSLMVCKPEQGQNSSWDVKKVIDGKLFLNDLSNGLGNIEFAPVKGRAGWFSYDPPVSKFYTYEGVNLKYLIGRKVACNGKIVAEITDWKDNLFRLSNGSQPYSSSGSFHGTVCEMAPGDRIDIPVNDFWPEVK